MFSSLPQPNVGFKQIAVKTIHSNLYFHGHACKFFLKPTHQRFLVIPVNAGSCMAVWLMTDEVLTERRAGWHVGRRRSWRLRGRPEIALLLLHYSITSQVTSLSWLPLHHATTNMHSRQYSYNTVSVLPHIPQYLTCEDNNWCCSTDNFVKTQSHIKVRKRVAARTRSNTACGLSHHQSPVKPYLECL